MGIYPKSGNMFYPIRKEAPRSDPTHLTKRMRTRHWDLPWTASQVIKRHPKMTPKVRTKIVDGLAQVVMKLARTTQIGIPTRNPMSPVPTEWPDN